MDGEDMEEEAEELDENEDYDGGEVKKEDEGAEMEEEEKKGVR